MNIFGLKINISIKRAADEPPQLGRRYYHKEIDPHDMVKYVIPKEIKDGEVIYTKIYKAQYQKNPAPDQCSIREFNRWYKQ